MKRIVIFAAMLTFCAFASAQNVSYKFVTDKGIEISVNAVDYILAADDDDSFAVVKTDGETVTGILELTVSEEADGIKVPSVKSNEVGVIYASDRLVLSNLRVGEKVEIFNAEGRSVYASVASADSVIVDVKSMNAGVYVLKTSRSSVKFIKR